MNENPQSAGDRPVSAPPPPAPPPPPPPRRGHPLRWLVLLLLAGAAGWGLWRAWQWGMGTLDAVSTQQQLLARQARELGTLRAQLEEMASRQTDLAAAVRRNGTDIAALDGRIEDGQEALSRLGDMVEGGRTRMQLAAVEQLLLMANDRLLLARDSATALKALDLADQRLAQLNDPQLFRVREALARERAELASLAVTDQAGLSLALSELARRVPQLPLRARSRERFEGEPGTAGALERTWAAVKAALSGLFALRRSDTPPARLLAPQEEALVEQILRLRVEGARLALLAGDTRAFRDLSGAAAEWLGRYYDESDPGVRAALAELQRLAGLKLAVELPDISRSLALLRAHLGAAPR
jgi:uroporphyrin-III C-methyltransferase